MNKIEISIDRKPKRKPKSNSGAEKYNYQNGNVTRRIQRQICAGRRMN